jgi:hypothetical protein
MLRWKEVEYAWIFPGELRDLGEKHFTSAWPCSGFSRRINNLQADD